MGKMFSTLQTFPEKSSEKVRCNAVKNSNFDFRGIKNTAKTIMSVPVCITNKIVIDLPEKFSETIKTPEGINLFVDTTFRPEWHATIQAKVVSVPRKLTIGGLADSIDPDRPFIGQKVRPGDTIIFNYMVVMDRTEGENIADVFTKDERYTFSNPFETTWSNKKGQQIVRIYMKNDKYEAGLFDIKSRSFVEQVKGSALEIENWMGKFTFDVSHFVDYNNLLTVDSKDYFMVDYSQVIAIKREKSDRSRSLTTVNEVHRPGVNRVLEVETETEVETEVEGSVHASFFEMVGQNLLLAPIHKPAGPRPQGKIEVFNMEQETDFLAWGRVVAVNDGFRGTKLSLQPGDIAYCDSRYIEQYTIDGQDYWVVKQNRILGKK